MSLELKLLDHFKLSNRLSVNFACEYSEDGRLFVLTDTGIYVVSLRGYPTSPFPTLSCRKSFFKVSNYLPSANVDLDINSFHKDLQRFELYEVTMATEYSGNLDYTSPTEPSPLSAQWSPRGLVGKTDCMLAVLTNSRSLELYVKYVDENELVSYSVICNVSQEIINVEKVKWTSVEGLSVPTKLNVLKERIGITTPTAFTWSHLINVNDREACVLFVGHINGDITIWRIEVRAANSKEESKLYFLGRYSTNLSRITVIYWHRTTEFGGGLCFADCDGKMSIVHISDLNKEAANIGSELAFWTEPDKILVDKISVLVYQNRAYVLLVKQCFLIIYGISESGEVFDQKVCNVGHYYITGLHHFDNIVLVLTMPGVMKQYTISVEKEKISLEEKIIPLKSDMSKYRTHGLFISSNRIIFGVVTYPCHLRSFRKIRPSINVFLFHDILLKPFEILWEGNTSGSLRDFWDCFKVLRITCLKEKRFPWLGLPPAINYDNLSLIQLKTLRWVAKLSEMVFNMVPVIKSYAIKPYVILHYLVEIKLIVRRINDLLNLRNSGKSLSVFQMRSIDLQNFFLKEVVAKNILAKANVGKNFINEIRHVMSIANELEYPPMLQCTWCGEKLIGSLCLPPHADSRCCISMMPIHLVPAYKCPFCKAVAHKEVEKEREVIFCPYCDIPMEERVAPHKVPSGTKQDYELECEEVKSPCFEDCLKEDINYSDIEENTSDYVIFSDSEDELGEDESKLRTLYKELSGMSLEQIIKWEGQEGGGDGEEGVPEPGPSRKVIRMGGDMEVEEECS